MFRKIVITVIICICTSNIYALKSDQKKPLQINGNSGYLDNKNGVANLKGNVTIIQGSMKVTAENGTVTQIHSKSRFITLNKGTKQVRFVQDQDDGGKVTALCNKFEYNEETHLATLTGNVLLNKGKDTVTGEILTYDTVTEEYKILSAKNQLSNNTDRVSITLTPKENNGKQSINLN